MQYSPSFKCWLTGTMSQRKRGTSARAGLGVPAGGPHTFSAASSDRSMERGSLTYTSVMLHFEQAGEEVLTVPLGTIDR
jgi:hypothetical protein